MPHGPPRVEQISNTAIAMQRNPNTPFSIQKACASPTACHFDAAFFDLGMENSFQAMLHKAIHGRAFRQL